jgi:transcription elongation factor Elf1
MKIKEILSEHANDFTAIMECEHCGHESKNTTGYHDTFYHTRVIPNMHCGACGKNRSGFKEANTSTK